MLEGLIPGGTTTLTQVTEEVIPIPPPKPDHLARLPVDLDRQNRPKGLQVDIRLELKSEGGLMCMVEVDRRTVERKGYGVRHLSLLLLLAHRSLGST
jgi:hypothetical protein